MIKANQSLSQPKPEHVQHSFEIRYSQQVRVGANQGVKPVESIEWLEEGHGSEQVRKVLS